MVEPSLAHGRWTLKAAACPSGFCPDAGTPLARCCRCQQTCLDINECLSISQLDPNCTCARCGCKNTYGGYQ